MASTSTACRLTPTIFLSGSHALAMKDTNTISPTRLQLTNAKRYRPVAYRVPLIAHQAYGDKTTTVSHLCHNNWCYNWDHHTLESLEMNKARTMAVPPAHAVDTRQSVSFPEHSPTSETPARLDRLAGQRSNRKSFLISHCHPTFASLIGCI